MSILQEREELFKRKMKKLNRETLLGLIIFAGIVNGFGGFVLYIANRNTNINSCIQSAEQQQFSPDLCANDCFRESYLELQREYKIEDMSLAYGIAVNKCETK
mgnify:CR=1 FL=1